MPTGSALRASANEIVQHTREQAAYEFAERLPGIPRSAGLELANWYLTAAEKRQPSSLMATERTRRAAAALATISGESIAATIRTHGLAGARLKMAQTK